MTDAAGRPTVAEVSLGALRENCREARRLVGEHVGVMAVVKADGYGHGAVASARAFVDAGARSLGVSSVEEGVELRRAGLSAPIVVLGGAFGDEASVVEHDLELAVWTADRARRLAAAAEQAGRDVLVHLKLDTGMARLGLDVDDVTAFAALVATMPRLQITGVFSHMASADAVETTVAKAQIARFRAAVDALAAAGVRPAHVHLANSATVLAAPEAHHTLVRPGLMLYGYAPAPHLLSDRITLRPAMRLVSRLAQVRRIPEGRPVGYGGTWVAARPSSIGTVPVGYADGYRRAASNRAEMVLHGRRVPIAGRVCMDHTMLDVTDVDGAAEGDRVLLFGTEGETRLGAEELASWTETIPYEVLTSIGKRVRRVYVEEFDA